jgi:hypothetical protein
VHFLISEENKVSSDVNDRGLPHYAAVDHLLEFINTDKPLNYVLCGYFSKIVINLLNLKTNNFIKYLFLCKKEALFSMVFHSNMKSISDVIIKILNTNVSEIEGGEEVKKEMIIKIFAGYYHEDADVNRFYHLALWKCL